MATSLTNIKATGTNHERTPVKYSPAQKHMAYTGLKFHGNNPGQRMTVKITMRPNSQAICLLSFIPSLNTKQF
jgi:hypothetical protein